MKFMGNNLKNFSDRCVWIEDYSKNASHLFDEEAVDVARQQVLGGAAVSEQLHPGFTYSVCSYVVSLLRPQIIRDLDLDRIDEVRNQWAFYRDRRPDMYEALVAP